MKTTLLLLTAFFAVTLKTEVFTQNEPLLTLVTTIDPKDASQIVFEPEGTLEISYWKNAYAQITIQIPDNGFSRQQLKALVPLGIFKIEPVIKDGSLHLTMPGQAKNVSINGKKVIGHLNFELQLPAGIKVNATAAVPSDSNS